MVHGIETTARLNAEAEQKSEPTITSLQRELAEARAERDLYCTEIAIHRKDCEALAGAVDEFQVRTFDDRLWECIAPGYKIMKVSPAPSDVKGEDQIADAGKMVPLTPLTDPSVRGVLVACNEFDKDRFWLGHTHIPAGWYKWSDSDGARVAAARGEPGLKKLEPGMIVGRKLDNLITLGANVIRYKGDAYEPVDPAIYGIPDGGERIKELEAENNRLRIDRDNYNSSRDHALNAIAEALAWPDAKNRTIENAVSNLLQRFDVFKATWMSDAERLRKAIQHVVNLPLLPLQCRKTLQAALSPSPAAGEPTKPMNMQELREHCYLSSQFAPKPSPAAASGATPGSADFDRGIECDSAPAAGSQGGENIWKQIAIRARLLNASLDTRYHDLLREHRDLQERLEVSDHEHSALSARLAACEERCKNFEAGVREHRHSLTGMACTHRECDARLWSLLTPRRDGKRSRV